MKRIVAVLALAIAPAGLATAQTPLGGEFQVNTSTTNNQGLPDVAYTPDGRFIVVWYSGIGATTGTDTSGTSIQGQIYAADGSPQGGEFQVNTYTTGSQLYPSLAVRLNGDFVVVWDSPGSSGTDTGTTWSIQGRRYAASGSPQGAQFQVNTYTTSQQRSPSVGMDADGNFVVVWHSGGSSGSDSDSWGIQGQRYSASGVKLGTEFQVNTYTTDDQEFPSVGVAPDGSFVVAWTSEGSLGSDVDRQSIQGQRYASNGVPQGSQFQVNTNTEGAQWLPAVARTTTGGSVIAWAVSSPGTINAQRYAADGSAQGGEFVVDDGATESTISPDISARPDGRFVVVWEAVASTGSDTDDRSIQARTFTAAGEPEGPVFQVNTYVTGDHSMSAVAADDDGFVVVWRSPGSAGTDTHVTSIQGQRYLPEPAASFGLAAGLVLLLALRARRRA